MYVTNSIIICDRSFQHKLGFHYCTKSFLIPFFIYLVPCPPTGLLPVILTANIQGMHYNPEGPAPCYLNSYKEFPPLDDKHHTWMGFESTVAESHLL